MLTSSKKGIVNKEIPTRQNPIKNVRKMLLNVFHFILLKLFSISLKKSSEPAANAIKPSERSNKNCKLWIALSSTISKELGPTKTPTIIKPVMVGRPVFLK